ncbi:MAG: FAD-dependent oxidoreductase [Gammaproteobacteria bacterium]|nr:FAD-dependent oxidoreductase [Gammaproteobacteria bacterium]
MDNTVVIAGAGHAAGQVVASLKQKKFAGRVVVLGDEPYLPYQRPPLSKKFLSGEMPAERLYVKPASFYDDTDIDVHLNSRIGDIDRSAKCVHTEDGAQFEYSKLVLATGSRVRRIDVAGSDLRGIFYLRNIQDVDDIRGAMAGAKRLVIVGAGYIGLEVAAVARTKGLEVTVLEMTERVMSRVVSPEVSAFYEQEHRERGVDLRLATGLAAFHGTGAVDAVESSDGKLIPTDFVVIGVGILPNTELAASAGLEVDDGIVVDDRCATSDRDIFAVGDCTRHPNTIYARNLRLESVHNALEQAKTAAANICGDELHYSQVPWFWSDQYDLKLQIAGLSEGYDQVVMRGDLAARSFACCYLDAGRLIAVDAVNAPRDFIQAKPLIAAAAMPDPERLADSDIMLKDLL